MLYDVVIVGSGLAGLVSALSASQTGAKVALLSKGNPLRSNSSMASGGINAALATMEDDTPLRHAHETYIGGDSLGERDVIEQLCSYAPEMIHQLREWGVNFDTNDYGVILQRPFGGAGAKRTCFIADKTGAFIVQALLKQVRQRNIPLLSDRMVLSLLSYEEKISGLSVLNTTTGFVEVIASKSVVLATGGFAGIWQGATTNPTTTTGDGLILALEAGLELVDMEFVQFHPTGLFHTGALVSEAVRGEGAYLVNDKGERFVDELSTRDKVSRAIAEQFEHGHKVFIDARHLSEEILTTKLPSFCKSALTTEGVNPLHDLVPIKPVAHYTMGGIATNAYGKTSLDGLYACGECASNGLHGANRLGGNSLMECAVSGMLCGHEGGSYALNHDFSPIDYRQVFKDERRIERIMKGENHYNLMALKRSLGKTLFEQVGIFRDEEGLIHALEYIEYLQSLVPNLHPIDKTRSGNVELVAILEFTHALTLAYLTTWQALERKESRGSHARRDYPYKERALEATRYAIRMKKRVFVRERYPKTRWQRWFDTLFQRR